MSDTRVASVATHIHLRLAGVQRDEIHARYDLGRLVHAVRYSEQFGAGAQAALSQLMNLDESVLRRHARVAETIRGEEFTTLLQLRMPSGASLSWSHLEVLAQVRAPTTRLSLAVETAARALSVRVLRSRVGLGEIG